ncbi:hypothetical protein Hypma_014518 [Hypsizygus marmoreus]|uniref:Uncharacterized protein n=1 Tax=Hypsizygus marmoreus TaxID=39966 RepID=A0A369JBV4_HYPMA|nr:hypothetical protein Hypma_014518 [Hypsizygus marmoreus]
MNPPVSPMMPSRHSSDQSYRSIPLRHLNDHEISPPNPTISPVKKTLLERIEMNERKDLSRNQGYHGTGESLRQERKAQHPVPRHGNYSDTSGVILQRSSKSLDLPNQPPLVSLQRNGTTSSRETQSTLTSSSALSTTLELLRRTLDASDQLRSSWEHLSQPGKFKRVATGPPLGMPPSKRRSSPSNTVKLSSETTPTTSKDFSLPNSHPPIHTLLPTTKPFVLRSEEDNLVSSLTFTDSLDSKLQSWPPMESSRLTEAKKGPRRSRSINLRFATASTPPRAAPTPTLSAFTATSVENADSQAIQRRIVKSTKDVIHGLQPKYLRYNLWREDGSFTPSCADWTLHATPLPSPPQAELDDPIVSQTIRENPHLFAIVTPIKVDVFEQLLSTHPNQPFVKICLPWPQGRFLALGQYSSSSLPNHP